jgi:hypothetical protein
MSKIEKRIVVSSAVERLYTYLPEAKGLIDIWPGLLEVGEVEHLPCGGVIARWIFKLTGAIFADFTDRSEPLADRERSLALLGNVACEVKWNFHPDADRPYVMLDSDHTYWSQS